MSVRRKDPCLNDAIELLDARFEEAEGNPDIAYSNLSSFELNFIDEEIMKCLDFRYYAENYHIINSKHDGFITLSPFWDSQEIFYGKIVEIQRQGRPVKIIVLKARQLGLCLDPKTKVLTSDLFWVPIGNVRVGESLVSVDENVPGGRGKGRKMRTAKVLAKREVFEEASKVTMGDGRVLIATKQHRFLSKRRGAVDTIWRAVGDMRPGDHIRYITKPWDGEQRYFDGWFAGILDGEGSMRVKKSGGVEVSVSQCAGDVYDRAFYYLHRMGYTFREEIDKRKAGEKSKLGNKPVLKLVLSRMNEIFQLLGQTKPMRFRGHWWEGKDLPGKNSGEAWETILSIEPLPAQRMIDLQTDTKTFIAEGFVSHNSTINEALLFHKTIFTEGVNALVVAQDPGQADYLFGMSRSAYDSLPWWMRPEARYESKGRYIHFDRRDDFIRQTKPGLRSAIYVEAANKMSGVAVGKAITACHLSELSLWPDAEVLAEQLFPTLSGTAGQIAIMESTARGRTNFWYDFWKAAWEGKVDWTPVFIEFFRVKKYSLPIPSTIKFERTKDEEDMALKVKTTTEISLTNEQLYWRRKEMEVFSSLNRGDDSKFFQEYPSASWQEAFQGSGICAFNKKSLQRMLETTCCPPLWIGEITLEADRDGVYRSPREKLTVTRKGETIPPAEQEGFRLRVWEKPEEGCDYYIGADVAHGVFGGDYSCAQVIRIGSGPSPDVQVAEWRGWINPTPFGRVLVALGYWYNTAELSIECNDVGMTTQNEVMRSLEYPKLFRWKHYDKIKNFITETLGWYTNVKTRDLIIAKFREYMDDRMVTLRSEELITECLDFSSEDEGRYEGQSTNDDRVFAMMITLFCAHDLDGWGNEKGVRRPPKVGREKNVDYSNTDYSPMFDGNREKDVVPNDDAKVPDEVTMWDDSKNQSDDDKWRML